MGIPFGMTRTSYSPRPCLNNHSRAALLFATTQSAKRHAIAWLMVRILCRSEKTPMSRTVAIVTEFVTRAAGRPQRDSDKSHMRGQSERLRGEVRVQTSVAPPTYGSETCFWSDIRKSARSALRYL